MQKEKRLDTTVWGKWSTRNCARNLDCDPLGIVQES